MACWDLNGNGVFGVDVDGTIDEGDLVPLAITARSAESISMLRTLISVSLCAMGSIPSFIAPRLKAWGPSKPCAISNR